MADLVIMETNQSPLGAVPAHVTCLATIETSGATRSTGTSVRHAALLKLALTLLASIVSIRGIRLLGPAHCYLHVLRLSLCLELQLNFPLTGLLNRIN